MLESPPAVLASLRTLVRHRALLGALTEREVRARYRGSVLGFFWSFLNPVLLLLVYTFAFRYVLAPRGGTSPEPYGVFLFTGLLPWTAFSAALLEASASVASGGALLKKVVFPAEVLPLVSVLSNAVHFVIALPILLLVLALTGHAPGPSVLFALPLLVVQLLITTGLSLAVAALSVLFRDVRDLLANLLTLWFFTTPVVYQLEAVPERLRAPLLANPMTHVVRGWQDALFAGRAPSLEGLAGAFAFGAVACVAGYALFDRLREVFPEEV